MIVTLIKILKDYFRQEGIFIDIQHNRAMSDRMNGMYYNVTCRNEHVVDFDLVTLIDDYRTEALEQDHLIALILETLIDTIEHKLDLCPSA